MGVQEQKDDTSRKFEWGENNPKLGVDLGEPGGKGHFLKQSITEPREEDVMLIENLEIINPAVPIHKRSAVT